MQLPATQTKGALLPAEGGQSDRDDPTSSEPTRLYSNQLPSTMTHNPGLVPLLGRVTSTQHIFNFIKETNSSSSLHDLRLGPEAVCVGGVRTLLVSPPEFPLRGK